MSVPREKIHQIVDLCYDLCVRVREAAHSDFDNADYQLQLCRARKRINKGVEANDKDSSALLSPCTRPYCVRLGDRFYASSDGEKAEIIHLGEFIALDLPRGWVCDDPYQVPIGELFKMLIDRDGVRQRFLELYGEVWADSGPYRQFLETLRERFDAFQSAIGNWAFEGFAEGDVVLSSEYSEFYWGFRNIEDRLGNLVKEKVQEPSRIGVAATQETSEIVVTKFGAAVESNIPLRVTANPPDALPTVDDISYEFGRIGGKLLRFLYGRKHRTSYETLGEHVWGNSDTRDATIAKTINRVNDRSGEKFNGRIWIERKNRTAMLIDKRGQK